MSYDSNSDHQASPQGSPSSPSTPTSLPPRSPSIIRGGVSKRGRGRGRGRGRRQVKAPRVGDITISSYCGDLVPFIIPFVRGFIDVKPDGNCGYRAVALQIYGDEKEWGRVRNDCFNDLNQRRDLYDRILPGISVDDLLAQIAHYGDGTAPAFNWMSLPEVGHVIATRYNVVLVSYGLQGGNTCLPAVVEDGNGPPTSMVVLGHVGGGLHFVLLQMCEENDFPIPSPALYWGAHHHRSADNLILPYRARMDRFNALMDATRRTRRTH